MFFAILFLREFFRLFRFDCAETLRMLRAPACQTFINFKTPSKTHKTKLIRSSFLLVFFAIPKAKKHAKTPTPSAVLFYLCLIKSK
jgi:hypothetical protein